MTSSDGFQFINDPRNKRIKSSELPMNKLNGFIEMVSQKNIDTVLSIPSRHYELADTLESLLGKEFILETISIIKGRENGAAIIKLPPLLNKEYVKVFSLALSYLMGQPRLDAGYSPLAEFKSYPNHEFLNLDLNRRLPLHNDGTYYDGNTDWLLLALTNTDSKTNTSLVSLLHLDDWIKETELKEEKLFFHQFFFQGPDVNSEKKKILGLRDDVNSLIRPIFYHHPSFGLASRVAHQWIHPKNREEARFINKTLDSLNSHQKHHSFELRKNEIYIINNHFWLHGRETEQAFKTTKRETIRAFGEFT